MPNPMPTLTARQLRNLRAKIDKRGPDDCWPWTAYCLPGGYGQFGLQAATYLAHRIAYKLAKGDPGKLYVCHTCDNRKCCNPNHLWLGTRADNMDDMVEKGRAAHLRGVKNGQCVLTRVQVTEIKATLKNYHWGMCGALAKKYGVKLSTISMIKTGKTWRHIV